MTIPRETLGESPAATNGGGLYFASAPKEEFFPSGCTLLNCVLGGGWRENRVINVVGDKSTGKTLLAIEAAANYRRKYPKAPIRYVEVEAAFDIEYGRSIGLPKDRVIFPNEKELKLATVEDVFRDLERVAEKGERSLYIVDSLDALSDEAEVGREVGEGTYGASKAKQMSALFRKINAKLAEAKTTVFIISQVRDAIGVTYGKKTTRSGGRALDFYASQILWLTHLKRLMRTRKGITRPYGVLVKAQAEKSKVGMPFRDCEFPIYFTYGMEDVVACVNWLREIKRAGEVFKSDAEAEKFLERLERLTPEEYRTEGKRIRTAVRAIWAESEKGFVTTRRKYDG